jgi:TetR/AcrR family transcriptional repressor of nem operon
VTLNVSRELEEEMSKGTETRNRIIAKAAPLFNRKGFDGCSVQEIVSVAGLEKGSLYGHFPNKEALAIAAFDYAWKETCTSRTAGMNAVDGSIEKLKIHVHNAVARQPFPGGCPLMNTVIDSDDGNAALKKEARAALAGWRGFLEGIVQQGQARNEIRAEVEAADVVSVTIALLEGAMVLDRFDKKAGFLLKAEKHVNSYFDSIALSKPDLASD